MLFALPLEPHRVQLLVTIKGLMVHWNCSHQRLCMHWAMLEAELHVTCWQTPKSPCMPLMRGLITMICWQKVTSGIWTPRRPWSHEASSCRSIKSAWANLSVPWPDVSYEHVLWFSALHPARKEFITTLRQGGGGDTRLQTENVS